MDLPTSIIVCFTVFLAGVLVGRYSFRVPGRIDFLECDCDECQSGKKPPIVYRREWKQLTPEKHSNGWGSYDGPGQLEWYWQYYCPSCGCELTPGPGGAGTNQVCDRCKKNYGCLPGALER